MHIERLKIFLKENPNGDFPKYKELTKEECTDVAGHISMSFFGEQKVGLELVNTLYEFSTEIVGVNVCNENFMLSKFFKEVGIKPAEKCYIDWYRFDSIDVFNFVDIDKNFDYVYYPGADDICIFDETLKWVLFVDHDGWLRILLKM